VKEQLDFIRKYQILNIILVACLLIAGFVLGPYFWTFEKPLLWFFIISGVALPLLLFMQGRKHAIRHSFAFTVLWTFPVRVMFESGVMGVFILIYLGVLIALLKKEKTVIAYWASLAPYVIFLVMGIVSWLLFITYDKGI